MVNDDDPSFRVTLMSWLKNVPAVVIIKLSAGITSSADRMAQLSRLRVPIDAHKLQFEKS